MDDTIQRYRYPRYNSSTRRKKRNTKEGSSLAETVVRQVFFSVVILLAVVVLRNVDTPVTNYMIDKFQYAIFYDLELKSLFNDAGDMVDKVRNGEILRSEELDTSEEAIPVSGAISSAEDLGVIEAQESYCLGEKFMIPAGGTVGSGFGERVHPIKNTVELHKGIDIEGNKGDYIKASLSGVVVDAGSSPSYGNYLRIWHSQNLETLYAHCSNLTASKGQKVKQGDIIAQVGDTGNAVGTHLHFEIWKDGKAVNPLEYMNLSAN